MDFNLWAMQNLYVNHYTNNETIQWKSYPYLLDTADEITNNRFLIINKFRQAGISTLFVGYGLWDAIHHPDRSILFQTRTDREATSLNKIMRCMIDNLPFEPKIDKINDHKIIFDNGSKVYFNTAEGCCGIATSHVFIDEAAFISNMKSIWTAIWPTLSMGVKCTVASTPNKPTGWFYDTYKEAVEGNSKFKALQLNWRDHPEFKNLDWEKEMISRMGAAGFLNEFAGCFVEDRNAI